MKTQADKHRSDMVFDIDDRLYLKLQLYRQLSSELISNQKLSKRHSGPFQISEKIGPVATNSTFLNLLRFI